MLKVIIAGGRDFKDYPLLRKSCLDALQSTQIFEVVSGGAKGADALGERFAVEMGVVLKKFPADWDTHGKSAGLKRNLQMADYADMLIAFWDGESRGTKHMIECATQKGLKVLVIQY